MFGFDTDRTDEVRLWAIVHISQKYAINTNEQIAATVLLKLYNISSWFDYLFKRGMKMIQMHILPTLYGLCLCLNNVIVKSNRN